MRHEEPTPGARWWVHAMLAVLLMAVIAVVLLFRGEPEPESKASWTLGSGAVVPSGGPPIEAAGTALAPGVYAVPRSTVLARKGIRLDVRPESVIRLLDADSLPRVLEGSLAASMEGPVGLGPLRVDAESAVEFVLGPQGIVVTSGRLQAWGRMLTAGSRAGAAGKIPEGFAEPPEPAGTAADEAPTTFLAGRVVDAATGEGIAGASVKATAFHGAGGPAASRPGGLSESRVGESPGGGEALGAPAAAGWPSIHAEGVETDGEGQFWLRAIEPDNARLALYLEVTHPAFAPQEAVLTPRTRTDGVWLEARVEMRRARNARVQIVDSNLNPMPNLPVRVTSRSEDHYLLGEKVSLSHTRRLVKKDLPRLLHTDATGSVQVAVSNAPYDFELLHPLFHLYYRDVEVEMVERVTLLLRFEGTFRIIAHPGWIESHVLVDGAGLPIVDSEIELRLAGMTPRRLRTDGGGRFTIGILPYPPGEPPLGYTNPRTGKIRVLTPEYFKREVDVAFPSTEGVVEVRANPAGRLQFTLAISRDEEVVPIPADGVKTSVDTQMTLVRRSREGYVEYRGPPPPTGSVVDVFLPGYLPAAVLVPAIGRSERDVDLGNILLEPGWTQQVRLTGVPRECLRGALLTLGIPWQESLAHEIPVPADGILRVSGLERGTYRIGVEGPRVVTFSGQFLITEANLAEPIGVPLVASPEEDVLVSGRVVDLGDPEDSLARVVERYSLLGEKEPLTFPDYPLPPDGLIGSRRRLAGVVGVDVAVISPRGEVAEAVVRRRPGDPPFFVTEDLRFLPRPRAVVAFGVRGLGRVAPPRNVAIDGPVGLETLARPSVRRRRLVVENLYPGRYTLRWGIADGGEEALGFEVPPGLHAELSLEAFRSAGETEGLEVLVTDSQGTPLDAARIAPTYPDEDPLDPGVKLARVRPDQRTKFRVSADGYLSARVEVAPGGVIPTHVRMYRPATFHAELLAPTGEPVDDIVKISWEPLSPSAILYGIYHEIRVPRGRIVVTGVPPLPRTFTLRLGSSDVAIRRDWTLREGKPAEDMGVLRFEETRTLAGVVHLPDGSAGAGATVALVPPADAYRFPFREGGVAKARYSVEADAQGAFEFEGLPVDLFPVPALVARLAGYGDAVVEPLDLRVAHHRLVLRPEASLVIDVGYADGRERKDYGFWLQYTRDLSDPDAIVQLGELAPRLSAGTVHRGVEPGLYRVRWGLRNPYEPLPGHWRVAEVFPGLETRLRLPIEGRTLRGRARLNGSPVERGWILITDEPGPAGSTSVGRILDGEFLLVDPPPALRAHAAVIPEESPQPLQNIARGEALPAPVRNYRSALRSGVLNFDYQGHHLTVRLRNDFLARHPGAVLHFDHYVWERNSLRKVPGEELLETPTVTLFLLTPGPHRISVRSSRGTLIHARTVDLREDRLVDIGG